MSGAGEPPNRRGAILDLIDELEAVEERLLRLTGGQVDAVVGRSGERHLLPVALGDLLRSAGTFRNIFQHAAVGIVSTDAKRRLREANPAFCAMLGEAEATLLGTDLLTLVTPEHAPRFDALVQELERAERPDFIVEKRFRHRSGGDVWFRVSVSAVQDPSGRHSGLIAVFEDISARKDAEADNRRLGDHLLATMASVTDAFFTLDPEFHFSRINDAAERLFGPREALLGQPISILEGFGADSPFGRALCQTVADQAAIEYEGFFEPAGRWLQMRAYGAAGGLIVMLLDVTERRERQERLHLLETSLDRLSDLVIITEAAPIDLPGPRIVFVNAAFERRTGFTFEEVRGRTPRLLQGPKTQRAELDRIHNALRAQQPVRVDLINYTKAGEPFWSEIDIAPVSDAAGTLTHYVAVQRDITDRKRVQAELEQQAALLDLVQDSIVVRGMDDVIRFWNRGAERIYGWTAAEAIGRRVQELIYFDAADSRQPAAAVLAKGSWNGPLAVRRKDGSRRIVEARLTLVRGPDGAPAAIMGVNTDITDRLEMEERLRQSQRLEVVGQLTGGIAHDFNNLLTIILGNAEFLTEALPRTDPLFAVAEMMVGAAERGAALTSQLLAFSRRQSLAPKVIDVNRLLEGLSTLMRRTLGENIEIRVRPGAALSSALIDPLQLENALLNLCINARDAMPHGGRLTIETMDVDLAVEQAQAASEVAPGRYVMIAVSDTGEGMSPETLARAFEPFFTTKDVGRGSGLGLSMVFGFMKQSGGHVAIESTPGTGTIVRMYLPSERSPGGVAAAVRPPGKAEMLGGAERLLVVEDNAAVRQHVARQLLQLGYQVVQAEDAPAALRALEAGEEFQLLFTDIVMPGGMNGVQLALEARRHRPGLRVLFTSGFTEGAVGLQELLASGMVLLHKPYRRQDLAEHVRRALDGEAYSPIS